MKLNIRRFLFRLYAIVLVLLSFILISVFIANKDYIKTESYIIKLSASEQKIVNHYQPIYEKQYKQLNNKISAIWEEINNLKEEKLNAEIMRELEIDRLIQNKREYINDAQTEAEKLKILSEPPTGKRILRETLDYNGTAYFTLFLLVIWAVPYTIHFIIEWLISGLRG